MFYYSKYAINLEVADIKPIPCQELSPIGNLLSQGLVPLCVVSSRTRNKSVHRAKLRQSFIELERKKVEFYQRPSILGNVTSLRMVKTVFL